MQIHNFPEGFLATTKLDTHLVGLVTPIWIPDFSNSSNFSFNVCIKASGTLLGALIIGGTLLSIII